MSKNRFAALKNAKKTAEPEEIPRPLPETNNDHPPEESTSEQFVKEKETPKVGRPAGKRSSAEFQQVTAYVRRQTYKRVGRALFDQEPRGEFSDLIEQLLQEWLNKQ